MASRIEIELTSQREDATWTWRAAGAREPKGTLDGAILPADASVGTVYRAEADFTVDGIDVLSVTDPARQRKDGFATLELLGSSDDEPLVTTTLAKGSRGGDRNDRGGRGKRDGKGRGPKGKGAGARGSDGDDRGGRARGGRSGGGPRNDRPEVPPPPSRPKAPRLRAKRTHRNAFLDGLPPEQRPIAEQALKGGVGAVRKAIDEQNKQLEADGKPAIKPDALVAMAESLLPRLRTAEWHDKAEAAVDQLDEVDLRDLRSVVTAADKGARDDETRDLAAKLRVGLTMRIDRETEHWIEDLADAVKYSRTVRGLRLSSRPPKAGTAVPQELSEGIIKMTNEALSADVSTDRWIRILDELAFSPIRARIVPVSLPAKPSPKLLQAVKRLGNRLPDLAQIFDVEAETDAERRKRRADEKKQRKDRPKKKKAAPKSEAPKSDAPESLGSTEGETAKGDEPTSDAPKVDSPKAGEPKTGATVTEGAAVAEERPTEDVSVDDGAATADAPPAEVASATDGDEKGGSVDVPAAEPSTDQ